MDITREQAELVLAAIEHQFAWALEGTNQEFGPKLVEDWDWTDSPVPFAIIWEEGPFEWALRAASGGIDPEMADAVREFNVTVTEEKPVPVPDSLYLEPVTNWAVGIYEK
jgi:hypothetical protein